MTEKTLYQPRFDEPLFAAGEDVLILGICSTLHGLSRSPHIDWKATGDSARFMETWTRKGSPVFTMAHSTIPGIKTRLEDPVRCVTLPGDGPNDLPVKIVALSRLFGTAYTEREVNTFLLMSDVTGIGEKLTAATDALIESHTTSLASFYCKAREIEHTIIARACEILFSLTLRHPGFFAAYPLPHL